MKQTFGDYTALAAGGLTGVAHVTAEFPFDTIKSRYQTNPMLLTYKQCVHELLQPKVLKSASRALVPALVRAVFAHGVSFAAVQQLKTRVLDHW